MKSNKTSPKRMNSHYNEMNNRLSGQKSLFLPLAAAMLLLLITACSSIDCPMNNLVYTQYQLMRADGKADTLSDTLTITTNRDDGNDSVLINKEVDAKTLSLPISYTNPVDSFFFEMRDTATKTVFVDTLTVEKENTMHFESTDCGVSYFHKLTSVNCTKHRIDSVRIINPDVNYDTSKKHFYIYFSPQR